MSREDISREVTSNVPVEIPFDESGSHHDVERLMISTIDISKLSMCPIDEVSSHLLRVIDQLLKILVAGTGEASLEWANPGTLIQLRIQAFATLLNLLGASTLYSSRRGLTQLDGFSKWNLIVLSRIIALSFDESTLFGKKIDEPSLSAFSSNPVPSPSSKKAESKGPKRGKRHVRSHFEFLNNGTASNAPNDDHEESNRIGEGDETSEHPADDNSKAEQVPDTIESPEKAVGTEADALLSKLSDSVPPDSVKVDSVTDFRSALKAGSQSVDSDDPVYDKTSSGSRAATAMIKAYSGPQAVSRRWMTAPAPGLATIREDGDDGGSQMVGADDARSTRRASGPLDLVDTELFLNPPKSSVKQMRVPKVRKNAAGAASDLDGSETSETASSSLSTDSGSGFVNSFEQSLSIS